ncbi:MAG: hypothetical protein KF713_10320 [Turneriella sp.]|nr:hypothetical protein [Turneriella sp.]
MRRLLSIFVLTAMGQVFAESEISFQVAGRSYSLKGGQGALTTKNGKMQLIIGARDNTAKAAFAITVELPQGSLETATEVNSEYNALSLVLMNHKGVYSVAPHTTLARDDFMRYHKKEEIDTGKLEDDPEDHPEDYLHECRGRLRFEDSCRKLAREKKRKRKKLLVEYKKHGPTWVNKPRHERIKSGDGIMREEKYRDTTFVVRLNPTRAGGKLTELSGTFAGMVLYNEGQAQATRVPLQNGKFSIRVQNVP